MGNSFAGKKTAKIMKINGETMKFKTPIQAREVIKDYPGHVLLDSEAVKHYGLRAKPLDPFQNLEPKRLYFLVELPKFSHGSIDHDKHRVPRRVRSNIHMSAKDRLESMMLARRSVSDLSIMGPTTRVVVDGPHDGHEPGSGLRVRMRLPKAEVDRLMNQCRDLDQAAEKIVDICMGKTNVGNGTNNGSWKGKEVAFGNERNYDNNLLDKSSLANRDGARGGPAGYKKRVGFMSTHEAEIGLVVASG